MEGETTPISAGTEAEAPDLSSLPVTWKRTAKFWWAQLWRGMLIALGGSFLLLVPYTAVNLVLTAWPVVERVVRLVVIVAVMVLGFVAGLRWAQKSTFSDFQVRVVRTPAANPEPESTALTLGEALRVWWALSWRSVVIATPINLVVAKLLFGAFMPVPGNFLSAVMHQLATLPVYLPVAIWATRAALTATYRRFHLALVRPEPATSA